jgi:cell division protein FtsL
MITKAKAIKKVSFLSILLLSLVVVSAISVGGCHWNHHHRYHYR